MPDRSLRKEDIAKRLEVHWRTVCNWAKEGCPHERRGPGRPYYFNEAEVKKWLTSQDRTGKPGRPENGHNKPYNQAKLMLTEEQALLARIKRQEEEGKLHDVDECGRRRLAQVYAVKAAFLSLPRSVAPELTRKKRAQIEEILTKRITDICEDFANGKS